MAINPELLYPGKIAPSDADYPFGSARNITVPGDGTGTPWEAGIVKDDMGLKQSLLTIAGIVPSENPDTVQVSQYMESLATFNGLSSGLIFPTLQDAVDGNVSTGQGINFTKLAANRALIRTKVNHVNSDSGGGTFYRLLTAAEYGATPDGVLISGVLTGADHFAGGGTDFVLKLEPLNGEYWAEMFGLSVDTGQGDGTTIFDNAFAYLAGRTMHLPYKRLRYSGEVLEDKVSIVGVRPPVKKADNTGLENGSIIVGTLALKGTQIHVEKFGVDHGIAEFPVTPQNAFVASPVTANSGTSIYAQDIVGLGRDASDAFHAILIEGYKRTFVNRMYGFRTFFGVALKVFDANIGDLLGEDNQLYNVIIKSDVPSGVLRELNIGRVVGNGTTGVTGVNFEIEAIGEQLQQVNIDSIVGQNANNIVRFVSDDIGGAIINNVNIGKVAGTNPQEEAIESNGTIVSMTIGQFNVQNCKGKAASFDKVNHLVINSFIASASAANTDYATDFFTIGADCGATQINQISLLDQFGIVGEGVMNYLNPRGRNKLAMYNAKLTGVGAPITEANDIGDTELAAAVPTYKVARLNVVQNTGPVTLELNGDNVEDGHVLVVDASAGVTFNIANEGGPSLTTIFNGEERTFVFTNDEYAIMARR
jgi:hypothetical protein